MSRWMAGITIGGGLWLAMAATARGQATVEAGLGAARAATSTAPAAGLGKAVSGIAGGLKTALKGGRAETETRPASTAATTVKPALDVDEKAAAAKWR